MLFSSFEFIFIFLPLVLLLYFRIPSRKSRLLMVLASSYVFYGFWNYKFIALLLFSTLVDFLLGIRIHETKDQSAKKRLLWISIIINLGVLGYFKYCNFFVESALGLARWLNFPPGSSFHLDVVLPIGISFYTFISLSYTIDVYLGRCKPHRDLLAYAGFVAFFPHLVAGPLIRHDELVHQLEDPEKGRFNPSSFAEGIQLFVIGLSKKILIADRLADGVNPVLKVLPYLSTLEAWLCAIGYSFQLYFDFSGYSDMAVGLAKMMNVRFPQNFNSPYKAHSITEFWQRWHISLSNWLRDYLYIPLGGNRNGPMKTYRNLLLTMLLGGLWHGANWVFLLWGAFHGVLLAIERALQDTVVERRLSKLPGPLKALGTFFLVTMGWVFFRSPDLAFATEWFRHLFSKSPTVSLHYFEPAFRDRFFVALFFAAMIAWFGKNTSEIAWGRMKSPRFAWAMALLFIASLAFFSKNSPFLYFQF
ncbi:MAG: MBOAT family protein [Bdellovibrionales bacterium]|nr:MBOAT family protein [Bdellovibrionales bacterium]